MPRPSPSWPSAACGPASSRPRRERSPGQPRGTYAHVKGKGQGPGRCSPPRPGRGPRRLCGGTLAALRRSRANPAWRSPARHDGRPTAQPGQPADDRRAGGRGGWVAGQFPEGAFLYSLRHRFATGLVRHGSSAKEAKQLLGHASLATTDRYLTATSDELRSAVGALPYRQGVVRVAQAPGRCTHSPLGEAEAAPSLARMPIRWPLVHEAHA